VSNFGGSHGNEMVERMEQAIEKNHDHVLVIYNHQQARKLVCNTFYVFNVVEHVVIFVHLYGEGFSSYKQDVRQAFSLVYVSLDVCQFLVHHVRA
jgi:ribosomal protein S9